MGKRGSNLKAKIKTINQGKLSDMDIVLCSLYSLVYEKLDEDPDSGIIINPGEPNQRKVKWSKVMDLSHMLGDFFIMREQLTECKTCSHCVYWEAISLASPHIGRCNKRNKDGVHKLHSCKKYRGDTIEL